MRFLTNRVERAGEGYVLTNSGIDVQKILGRVDHGMSASQICEELPGVEPADVHACKALAALVFEDRPEYRRNKKFKPRNKDKAEGRKPVKILLDENITWKIIPDLVNNITELSHVLFENMGGWRDDGIWERGIKGEFGIVITQDHDFRKLAEAHAMDKILRAGSLDADINGCPFVVHVDTEVLKKGLVVEAFHTRTPKIVQEASRVPRHMPYMRLDKDGLFRGPSVKMIFRNYAKSDPITHVKPEEVSTDAINWARLNDRRRSAGLQEVGPDDYPKNDSVALPS